MAYKHPTAEAMESVTTTVLAPAAEPAWQGPSARQTHAAPVRRALVEMKSRFPTSPAEAPMAEPARESEPSFFGLTDERLARAAARQAFVEMKTCFMRAASEIAGSTGAMLQRELRLSHEVVELWRLSPALLAALPRGVAEADIQRHEVLLQLEGAFPEGAPKGLPLS